MSVLNRPAIKEYLDKGELILNARQKTKSREWDLENDSYDLSAGTAIWKGQRRDGYGGDVNILYYSPGCPPEKQPTVTVQPGQMIFVVTREDLKMPKDVCGTVYSRNSLALLGILALNAGHVDPGYEGPIAIRLINLRSIPWTLTLGTPIFTVTFHTVDCQDDPNFKPQISCQTRMIARVLETANSALSNALYDLYRFDVERGLNEFKTQALEEFRRERDERWVKRDELWRALLSDVWAKIIAGLIFVAVVAAPIVAVVIYLLSGNSSP